MVSVEEIRQGQRANGPATIMSIGLANPPNVIEQSAYGDFYFRVTDCFKNNRHMKQKYDNICNKSMIKKRYFFHDEELLMEHHNICENTSASLNIRQDICVKEVPKLGKQAALKAIAEWGRPKSEITHLIFCTSCGVDMPSANFELVKLLDLNPKINRQMVYMQGCYAGGTVLRLAKDLAENNKGARILAVCSELTIIGFTGPDETRWDKTMSTILFGDGAAAMIIGADPIIGVEKPIFEVVFAKQTIIPDSEDSIQLHLREEGLSFTLGKENPMVIASNIEECLTDALQPLGLMPQDWNEMFWVPHPGGRAILDKIEAKLSLKPEKFRASRHVLWEYGNMVSACVFFILDEMRKRSMAEGRATTGEGLEWGVLQAFGPGVTVETIVLHSVPI